MKLFLDDERPCPEGWTLARTFEEAVQLLNEGNVTAVSLDHDLGTERTGYDLASLLEEAAFCGLETPEELFCHSANPVGRSRIEACFSTIRRIRCA